MIKFKNPDLTGYGFDLTADRVVRFNKYPDGTYLNSRATYSINKKQFTHFDLRSLAIQEQQAVKSIAPKIHISKWWIILVVFILIVSMSECSFSISSNTAIENSQ